jgi:hypothetical protein
MSPHQGIEPGTFRLQGGRSDQLSYAGKRRARGALRSAARHRRAGPRICMICHKSGKPDLWWSRLRESNTRLPRYEGGALPSELSRQKKCVLKIDKWSAAALPRSKATLLQGLPLRAERGAAGQFWTFTMSNSRRKTSTFAETIGFDAELRMHVTITRIASGDARHHDRQLASARIRSRTAHVKQWRKL